MLPYVFLGLALACPLVGPVVGYYIGADDARAKVATAVFSSANVAFLWLAQQAWTQAWTSRPRIQVSLVKRKKELEIRSLRGAAVVDLSVHAAHYEIDATVAPDGPGISLTLKELKYYGDPIATVSRINEEDGITINLDGPLTFKPLQTTPTQRFEMGHYALRIVFYHARTKQKYVIYKRC